MTSTAAVPAPRFRRVSLYNHAAGHLSFWHPSDWHLETADADRVAVTLWPDPRDPLTHILIEAADLGAPLEEGEGAALEEGVRMGLERLASCAVRTWRALEADEPGEWGVEWHCTFRLNRTECARTARMYSVGRHLYTITFQGSSPARFRHWKGMFEFVMLTVAAVPFSLSDWMTEQGHPDPNR